MLSGDPGDAKNWPTSILIQPPSTTQLYNIRILPKNCPKASALLWLLSSSHISSSMVGLQPAQEDGETSPLSGLTLRCPAPKYILMGSGEHPADGCPAFNYILMGSRDHPADGCPAPNYILMGSGEHPADGHAAFPMAGFLQRSTSMITASPAREAGLN